MADGRWQIEKSEIRFLWLLGPLRIRQDDIDVK
jgi:hypothetical protein